jgi:hypothetical protein
VPRPRILGTQILSQNHCSDRTIRFTTNFLQLRSTLSFGQVQLFPLFVFGKCFRWSPCEIGPSLGSCGLGWLGHPGMKGNECLSTRCQSMESFSHLASISASGLCRSIIPNSFGSGGESFLFLI